MASQFPPASELSVVDDGASTREALSAVFTLADYRVSGFADAETFLAAARGQSAEGRAARSARAGDAAGHGGVAFREKRTFLTARPAKAGTQSFLIVGFPLVRERAGCRHGPAVDI